MDLLEQLEVSVAMKKQLERMFDGEELNVVGIEGEVVETRKLLERANQRVEAVEQAVMAHDKKFIHIGEIQSK